MRPEIGVKPMRKGPLHRLADSTVLRIAASELQTLSRASLFNRRPRLRDAASRLRAIARRVPLWTDRR
jgi:hypothetical protein